MKPLRVVHLVYYGFERTVIDSQVVAPARRLAADGIDVDLVFLEDPLPWLLGRWRSRKAALTAAGIRAHFLPRVPRNIFNLNTRRLTGLFSRILSEQSPLVVHARGFQGADAVVPIKAQLPDLRLICDARGIEWAEYELDLRTRRGRPLNGIEESWKRSLEEIERRAVLGSDAVFCVSRAMIPFLMERTGRDGGSFDYVPCAADVDSFSKGIERREATRRELKVGQGPVLVYSGSMSVWQAAKISVRVASKLLAIDSSAMFLILSPTPEAFESLALEEGIPRNRLRVLNAAHQDIPRYLASADIALLLREKNVVNRYACPTKFAEYLACGLHVLATPAVEEVATTIRDTGCGTLIELLEDPVGVEVAIRSALAASSDLRRRTEVSTAAARERYDWSRHLATLKKWYRQLASTHSRPI